MWKVPETAAAAAGTTAHAVHLLPGSRVGHLPLSAVTTAACIMFCLPLAQPDYSSILQSTTYPEMAGHPEWVHNMPNPVPWARSQPQPESIVRFTASPAISTSASVSAHKATASNVHPYPGFSPNFIPNSQIKRSSSSDEEDDDYEFHRPAKVCATTDRVAAKLGHMNISSGNSCAPVVSGSSVEIEELEDNDPDPQSVQLVHLSDEMQSLMSHDSPDFVSDLLQQELDKSSKAVVLWTPNPIVPAGPIIETVESDDSDEVQDTLSVDSDGLVIEEIVDDDEAQMEVEL